MSQTKVQLIAPIGVVTATTLETTGVLTATTFVGDIAGTVTGITSTTDNLNLGIITATSFAGDFTGIGSGLTGTPNVVAGVVTATKFVGNTPGLVSGIADGTNINAGIITATSFVGNLTGNAAGLSTTTGHANLGIVTATSFHGSGANLDGVSSGPVAQQAVTANGSTTTIDLSSGNLIYMTQSANTTVAFANTEGNTDVVYLVRVKDASGTARTITWPSGIVWDGGSEPTLLNVNNEDEAHVFKLTTRDNGATWYASEIYNNDSGKLLFVSGMGSQGQYGNNSRTHYSSPVQIPGTWNSAGIGVGHVWATKMNGTLWAWGDNESGELGHNQPTSTLLSSPTQVGSDTTWNTVATAADSSMAVKTDGTLWASGSNSYGGILGLNDIVNRSSPTQIPGTTWGSGNKLNGGGYHWHNIKTDGTLWSWGKASYGRMANNSNVDRSSPVQVGSGTDWSQVQGNHTGGAAVKTDGTLWTWGMNSGGGAGSLGQNNQVDYSSPVQIPGTTWSKVYHQGAYAYGCIRNDGTLWVWGSNEMGELGQNNKTYYSSPVQIPGTNWASGAGSGTDGALYTKTDGTMWAWGQQTYGKLGQNQSAVKYSSPVQIPGTGWDLQNASNAANGYNFIALKS